MNDDEAKESTYVKFIVGFVDHCGRNVDVWSKEPRLFQKDAMQLRCSEVQVRCRMRCVALRCTKRL